ncbi:hypothetical protein CAPTEDRAFT_214052 [Capitella teleta]|uniref:Consortin N-terminal domain-containing protein n=1 Tax=Capitella teleta TaxID=283909 RepID=R7TSS7_CAPTE|nr:hypothetical protein CAPTEDRAFT_214052 [Capitella teleta]|eukprot:ELT94080.1 hypothetical protein CAPTEDRAFT_214052 [Capitella teleta]
MEEEKKTESPLTDVAEAEREAAEPQPQREAPSGEERQEERLIADAMGKEDDDDSSEEYSLEEFGDPIQMTANDRLSVYEKGQEYMDKGKKVMALKCFLRCLKGLQQSNTFQPLPKCLRMIADIYYSKGEDSFAVDKAVHFVQAEKLFYETALIDASEWERKNLGAVFGFLCFIDGLGMLYYEGCLKSSWPNIEHKTENQRESSTEISEIHRAQDYENLAKVCLEKKQPQLALEYQAKATKIRQQTLGDDHPMTAESLDLFTVIYGEVGKKQYSATQQTPQKSSEGHPSDAEVRQQEIWISRSLLWVLLFLCLFTAVALLIYSYCQFDIKNRTCGSLKRGLYYQYIRFKYFVYSFVKPQNVTYE